MNDRDSLTELYTILSNYTTEQSLPLTASALPIIAAHLGQGCDIYFRRRLSVCRTLVHLRFPLPVEQVDILLAVAISHYLPGDHIPEGYIEKIHALFSVEPQIGEILKALEIGDYAKKSNYDALVKNRFALIIRLAERSVLVEKLYEWSLDDAMYYIRETREYFFPMCIYAKEHYPEFLGAVTILYEKTKSLITINDVLLTRFAYEENELQSEILMLREENASIRSMIQTFQKESSK